MAKHLNRNRHRDTYILLAPCLFATMFTRPVFGLESELHDVFDMLGEILVALCVVGRMYCTTFLGGYKNRTLITIGPFAMCRNPLYCCSFVGVVGIAMMSNHVTLVLVIPALFTMVYYRLVRREEALLQQLFGAEYALYCAATPRFWPRIERFIVPDTLIISPKLLANAATDGLLWFLSLPIFELIEYAQRARIIPALCLLY